MSRIQRENDRYLARVAASVQAERTAADKRRREREERDAARREREEVRREDREVRQQMQAQYAENITNKSNDYGAFWVNTVGSGVPRFLHKLRNEEQLQLADRTMCVKVYDSSARRVSVVELAMLVQDAKPFPELQSKRGQINYKGGLHVSEIIYAHLRNVWHATPSSTSC